MTGYLCNFHLPFLRSLIRVPQTLIYLCACGLCWWPPYPYFTVYALLTQIQFLWFITHNLLITWNIAQMEERARGIKIRCIYSCLYIDVIKPLTSLGMSCNSSPGCWFPHSHPQDFLHVNYLSLVPFLFFR